MLARGKRGALRERQAVPQATCITDRNFAMQLRSFILAGFCAALCFGGPAFAAMPLNPVAADTARTDVITVAARSEAAELRILKKKKKPTEADLKRIGELEAKIEKDRADARAKAIEARKMAMREAARERAKADREAFLAKTRKQAAEPVRKEAASKPSKHDEPARPIAPVQEADDDASPAATNVALTGNNGELRSNVAAHRSSGGLFSGLFGGSAPQAVSLLPETRALDSVLEKREARKPFKVKPEFEPQEVEFSGYEAGTIVIDTAARRLYLVESPFTARRYAIAVGREGLQFKGETRVGDKQEWPRWIPTLDMQKREPKHYGQYKDGMAGGPDNPLGARAIYLYQGKKDTHLRIHGTNQPQTIGTSASNGCFRMINDQVMDLYRRVKMGAKVVIL
jgi:lipoprotein-anchoring transpeptidase ErfK/SrfK